MTNYDLRRGIQEYYGEHFQELNMKIDSSLRSTFGDFHWEGPRNWVGGTYEGAWTSEAGGIDYNYFMPGCIFVILLLAWSTTFTEFQTQSLIYLGVAAFAYVQYSSNRTDKKGFGEFFMAGKTENLMHYTKIALVIALVWIAICLSLSGLLPQSGIIMFQTAVSLSLFGVISLFIIIYAAPVIEECLITGMGLSTMNRYVGIFPSIMLMVIFRGLWHYVICCGNPIIIGLSMLFGLMVAIPSIQYRTKEIATNSHVFINMGVIILTMFGIITLQ